VSERLSGGGEDLEEGEEMFCLIIVMGGAGMHFFKSFCP
jgi:hypothetical protein